MQQFQVPQFITVEDKVIGPLTIKQFLYVAGGAGIVLIARSVFSGGFLYLIILVVGVIAAALAFLKINEQSFPRFLLNALRYYLKPRLYVWKQEPAKPAAPAAGAKPEKPEALVQAIPKLSQSKLSDLSWSLDLTQRLSGESVEELGAGKRP